ncbi:MAG: anti-sigma factor antagonist [Chloroflexi bacterium]|nr:MAG: anti-sigma factor antagonist [Chloroflexota bacterium]MBL1197166.1 anti-sigma factor antagonist [Chloroflexota bacterium]NOH14460.1 STAS domain-containing protein [Chloroflexota bacterium]
MEITTTSHKRCTVVKMDGRIDSNTSPDLKKSLDKIMEDGTYKIVFDMSGVDFISSSGVWVLMETQKACKRWNRGQLVIATPNERISRSLDLAGVHHFFSIYDDITEAVGSF